MNFRNSSIFIFFFILGTHGDLFNLTQDGNAKMSISYSNETKICQMFNDLCYVSFIVQNQIQMQDLNVQIENQEQALVDRIIPCNNHNQSIENEHSILECNKTIKSDSHDVYLVKISPQLIGYTNLIISLKNENKSYLAKIYLVVKDGQRLIDKIFLGYVWTGSIVIVFIMGLLLDKETLKKVITMPTPVIIGFFCQYLIMPLVRKIKLN